MSQAVQVEKLGGLKRCVTITVPEAEYKAAMEKRIENLKGQVNLPGFRKGKVPTNVVQQKYGDYVKHEVITELTEKTLQSALENESLRPVAMPHVDMVSTDAGSDFSYKATFEVFPEFKLVDLTKLTIKQPKTEVDEKDINEAIEKIRAQHVEWKEADKESAKEDRVRIDFRGTLDGEAFAGGTAQNYDVVLGQGQMLPDFEKPLLGKRAGDTLEFPVKFPKDYHGKDLAGKTAQFAVKIHAVETGELPELNDALFEKLQLKEKTLKGLQDEVRAPLQEELQRMTDAIMRKRLFDLLEDKHKLDFPEVLVDEEIKRLAQQAPEEEREELAKLTHKDTRKDIVKKARKNTAISLILQNFIEIYELELDRAKLEKHIHSMAMPYMDQRQFVEWYMQDEQRMRQAQATVLEQQLIEKMLSEMQTKDESLTYEQVRELANTGE